MILTDRIKNIIEKRLGADIELMGIKSIEAAILKGMKASETESIEAYEKLLFLDNGIYNKFVEEIIIPKTWFFRNKKSFIFLKGEIQNLQKKKKDRFIRVLSVPCSTGEEPYSIAATLFEAGLDKSQFHIDAIDISKKAISIAQKGVYLKNQTYIEDIDFQNKYIEDDGRIICINPLLKDQVSYSHGNLLDLSDEQNRCKYDVIFCRNVFIYFNQKAREKVLANLKTKLSSKGIMFTGHAEINIFLNSGFFKLDSKNSFTCKIGKRELKKIPVKKKSETLIIKKKRHLSVSTDIKKRKKIVDNIKKKENTFSFNKIKSFADGGNYKEAMKLCKSYIKTMEPNAEVYCIKGLIHQMENELDMAQNCFEKAIYLKPDYYDALLHMSILFEKKGSMTKSELFKKRAIKSYALLEKNENDLLENRINE